MNIMRARKKNLSRTNTLAYFASPRATKKRVFKHWRYFGLEWSRFPEMTQGPPFNTSLWRGVTYVWRNVAVVTRVTVIVRLGLTCCTEASCYACVAWPDSCDTCESHFTTETNMRLKVCVSVFVCVFMCHRDLCHICVTWYGSCHTCECLFYSWN